MSSLSLVDLINEYGMSSFSTADAFESLIRTYCTPLTEDAVATSLIYIMSILNDQCCRIEFFVEAISNIQPMLSWSDVFYSFGKQAHVLIMTEVIWLHLLLAWQQASLAMKRANEIASGNSQIVPPLESIGMMNPSRFVAPPLSMLPVGGSPSGGGSTSVANPQVLISYASFIVNHDMSYMSTLVPQTLYDTSPVPSTLLDLAQVLFTRHGIDLMEIHHLSLTDFLKNRFEPLNRDSKLFAVKLGVFLNEKLMAISNEDPNAIRIDGVSACIYCDALLKYAEAMRGCPGNPFDDPRIVGHFERLRLLLCDIFPEQAKIAGTNRKSFTAIMPQAPPPQMPQAQPQPAQQPSGMAGSGMMPNGALSHEVLGHSIHQPMPGPQNDLAESEEQVFAAFYSGDISSSQLVELMFTLSQYPTHTPEADLLARMLRTLFIECRHFPKYPTPELYRTAEFFGKLIRSELLLKRPELHLLAIRCCMEALRKDPSTNIFKFGLVVLQIFLPIAPCSPAFLSALTKMPHVVELFPSLIWYAEKCLQAMPPQMQTMSLVDASQLIQAIAPNQLPSPINVLVIPSSLFLVPQQAADNKCMPAATPLPAAASVPPPAIPGTALPETNRSFGNIEVPDATAQQEVNLKGFGLGQIEVLLEDPQILSWITIPNETVRNRISQVCNSIVKTNIEVKAKELAEYAEDPWLSYYIIKSRVIKEVNHLELYYDFCYSLGGNKLLEMLTNITYDCINILMKYSISVVNATGIAKTKAGNANRASSISSYKHAMKSLGTWLGMLTLRRNKPLKSKSFDIKHLLFSGYETGTLSVILPLVCSCLSFIKNSRIFKPPNPWSLTCLTTLAQLYLLPTCQQNHQFEIELLMRNLNQNLEQYLALAQTQPNVFDTLTPPPEQGEIIEHPPKKPAAPVAQAQNQVGSHTTPAATIPNPPNDPKQPRTQLLNALAKAAKIPAGLALFQKWPELRITVPIAMERAVKELVSVMSERAVVLAVGTTVELVLKDFALETEETLVKRAAHLMAAALAGSIAMVTGRPSLRSAIATQFKALVKTVNAVNTDGNADFDSTVEQAALVIAYENAHIASTLIEQVVIEQAVRAVQEALAQSLEDRRIAAEKGEAYVDPNFFGPGCEWPAALPPALRLNPSLDVKQLEVYKAFATIGPLKRVRDNTAQAEEASTPPTNGAVPEALSTVGVSVGKLKEAVKALMLKPSETPKYAIPPDSPPTIKLLATLERENDIFKEIENVVSIVQNCESRETVALCTARRLLRSIYDAAHRGLSFATDGDEIVEISYVYLEAFVCMLSRFDQLQLVHNLREVVTIWLVSASYLTPGLPCQRDGSSKLFYLTMTIEIAARSLIVLQAAAKYSMIEVQIIDTDFVSTLLGQAWNGLASLPATNQEQIIESAALTIEFALHVAYILVVDLRAEVLRSSKDEISDIKMRGPGNGSTPGQSNPVSTNDGTAELTIMPDTMARLQKFRDTGVMPPQIAEAWSQLKDQPLKFKFALHDALRAAKSEFTLKAALTLLFAHVQNPPEPVPRCLTLHQLTRLTADPVFANN